MKYRREVDGLRAVAVVPVILFHAGFPVASGGYVGVDIFFVISGYLITSLLISDLENGRFSLIGFYERRIRRILPALFLIMALSAIFAWLWMLPDQLSEFGMSLIAVPLFVSNVLFWRESGYFALEAEEKPLLHTWSLAVEEQYYLLFPLALLLLWRFGRRPITTMVVILALASLLVSEWGWRNSPTANFYLAPSRAWELLAGSLCAFYLANQDVPPMLQSLRSVLSATGLLLIGYSVFAFDAATPFPSLYALVPVGGTVLIILFADANTPAGRILSLQGMVGIGLVSYSAYLWHQPLMAFARLGFGAVQGSGLMIALAVLSFGLAYLTWRYVEQPFRIRAGDQGHIGSKAVFASCAVVAILLVAAGMVLTVRDGFPSRMPPAFFVHEASLHEAQSARLEAIRGGTCQFNGLGRFATIDTFIKNWECLPRGDARAIVAVYGDSHAADKAAAMRLAAVEPMQVTGAGCPLLPGPGHCGRLLELFHARAAAAEITTVMIANAFDAPELDARYLERMAAYWTSRYDRVILFTPTPRWHKLEAAFLHGGLVGVSLLPMDSREAGVFLDRIGQQDLPDNLVLLDTEELLCAGVADCSAATRTDLLLVDPAHLSVIGARLMGLRLRDWLALNPEP